MVCTQISVWALTASITSEVKINYRISANSFRGNCSFLNLALFTVRKLFKGGNYSRAETIRGNTVSNGKDIGPDFILIKP